MKKLILLFILAVSFNAFAVDKTKIEAPGTQSIDKDEITPPNENCPPSDRNCDGIPDDQQGVLRRAGKPAKPTQKI